ncbi:CC0125/CC1285 family lipoprotein [Piscirickettsia salmonis]|uniref:CC0125/CC1285 family lipoprotein n=1 Tax=Piscirickettsia salmonis TaxID=1238 RepID=UPI003EB9C1EB
MKNTLYIFIFLCLTLQGCATTYQSKGYSGGYSETQLSENMFKVSFKGNAHTTKERAEDFALLRSAELTLKNGYKYFAIVGANTSISKSTHTTPTTYSTTANAYGSSGYTYGNATTTQYGGYTYNISKPSTTNTIVCFKKRPKNTFTYNADFIFNSITKKYGIEKNVA